MDRNRLTDPQRAVLRHWFRAYPVAVPRLVFPAEVAGGGEEGRVEEVGRDS